MHVLLDLHGVPVRPPSRSKVVAHTQAGQRERRAAVRSQHDRDQLLCVSLLTFIRVEPTLVNRQQHQPSSRRPDDRRRHLLRSRKPVLQRHLWYQRRQRASSVRQARLAGLALQTEADLEPSETNRAALRDYYEVRLLLAQFASIMLKWPQRSYATLSAAGIPMIWHRASPVLGRENVCSRSRRRLYRGRPSRLLVRLHGRQEPVHACLGRCAPRLELCLFAC